MQQLESKQIELLAPAGNPDSLKAAIIAGANAIYFGLDTLNARAKASGFNKNNLSEWVAYCHGYNVKVFITLNVIIKEKEIDEVQELIILCEKCCVDAIIVQDFSLISLIKKYAPNVRLHASTQMGIHNLEGAKFAEKLGFSRVVLSRETLNKDIENIAHNTNLEIEIFAQGALCVSFSGNCYMSSCINGNSGNRGRCLQPCRLKYTLFKDNKKLGRECYALSMSDLSLSKRINEIKALGVSSIKIEGRLRRAEYVYYATSLYRKIIDNNKVTRDDYDMLSVQFNRGDYTEGYNYDNENKLMSIKVNGHKGLDVGFVAKKINNYTYIVNSKIQLNDGDGIKVFRNGIEIAGGQINKVTKLKDNKYSLNFNANINISDSVSLTTKSNIVYAENNRAICSSYHNDLFDNKKSFTKTRECIKIENDLIEINSYVKIINKYLVYSIEDYNNCKSDINNIKELSNNNKVMLKLPLIVRGNDMVLLKKTINCIINDLYGFYITNIYGLELSHQYNVPYVIGMQMNILNSLAIEQLNPMMTVLSPEIDSKNLMQIASKHKSISIIGYGKIANMNLVHCPLKLNKVSSCEKCSYSKGYGYRDRVALFELNRIKLKHCVFELLNSTVHYNERTNNAFMYFDCKDMSEYDILNVLNGQKPKNYTRGQFNKILK